MLKCLKQKLANYDGEKGQALRPHLIPLFPLNIPLRVKRTTPLRLFSFAARYRCRNCSSCRRRLAVAADNSSKARSQLARYCCWLTTTSRHAAAASSCYCQQARNDGSTSGRRWAVRETTLLPPNRFPLPDLHTACAGSRKIVAR